MTLLIKLMCKDFNVREDWLLNGTLPVFIETLSAIMEQLKKEFQLDAQKRRLFQYFFIMY